MEKEIKPFLVIKSTYKVRCNNCGFKGEAQLGKEPIVTDEVDGADWCPVCGCLALVSADLKLEDNKR